MADRNDRTISLIGEDAYKKLEESSVIVFGVGGVGGYTVEALARAGIGKLTLVDFDIIDVTNINRQIIALDSTVGKYKVDVMKDRILDINPNANVRFWKHKVTKNNIDNYDIFRYNYVIDAIDDISAKIALIEKSFEFGVKVISSMGTGNKKDPSKFKVDSISNTNTCPLAKRMRKELAKREIHDLKVVYSDEKIHRFDERSNAPASLSYMPATVGLLMASEVILDLIAE